MNRTGATGFVEAMVTDEDIATGQPGDPRLCPLALAIGRATGLDYLVGAYYALRYVPIGGGEDGRIQKDVILFPTYVQRWVEAYDKGEEVGPIAFRSSSQLRQLEWRIMRLKGE